MACWYCSVRPAEANHMLETNLNGDVDALKSYDQTKVAYNVRHVGIPRCGDCHRRHRLVGAVDGGQTVVEQMGTEGEGHGGP